MNIHSAKTCFKKQSHISNTTNSSLSRRCFLTGTAGLIPFALANGTAYAKATPDSGENSQSTPPPKYTLSPNLEILFPKTMSYEERLEAAAGEGAKAYSFWGFENKDLGNLRAKADSYGMRCASIAGSGRIGWTTGLTATGYEKQFLDYFTKAVTGATKVGAPNLITFVGARVETIPWDIQYRQIIAGLRKAGDIAGEAGVYLALEPLNRVESPQVSVLTAQDGFNIVREVDHPHVKLDFDMYHLQLSEGNLTNNLREGLEEGLIQFVEVGDVPGRFEPGTGEVNYTHIFNVLREVGYDGFIGMEHNSKTNYREAIAQVRRLAGIVQ